MPAALQPACRLDRTCRVASVPSRGLLRLHAALHDKGHGAPRGSLHAKPHATGHSHAQLSQRHMPWHGHAPEQQSCAAVSGSGAASYPTGRTSAPGTDQARMLTSHITHCTSLFQLQRLLADHHEAMDHMHVSAMLSRLAKLHDAHGDRFTADSRLPGVTSLQPGSRNTSSSSSSSSSTGAQQLTPRAVGGSGEARLTAMQRVMVSKLMHMAVQQRHAMGPRQLSSTLWALSKLDHLQAPMVPAVHQLLSSFRQVMWHATAQDLVQVLYARARLQCPPESSELPELLAAMQRRFSHFKPQDWSMALWALATLFSHTTSPDYSTSSTSKGSKGSSSSSSTSTSTNPSSVAYPGSPAHAAGRQHAELHAWLDAAVHCMLPGLPLFSGQALANTAWAQASLGYQPPSLFITSLLDTSEGIMHIMYNQELANTAWALAKFQAAPRATWLLKLERSMLQRMHELNAQDMSNLMYAMGMMRYRPGLQLLAQLSLHLPGVLAGSGSSQASCAVLWALSRMDVLPSSGLLDVLVGDLAGKMYSCNAQDIATAATAMAKLQYKPDQKLIIRFMQGAQASFSEFGPSELSELLAALATLDVRPERRWMEGWLVEAAYKLLAFRPSELTASLWALARMGYRPTAVWLRRFFEVAAPHMGALTPGQLVKMLKAASRLVQATVSGTSPPPAYSPASPDSDSEASGGPQDSMQGGVLEFEPADKPLQMVVRGGSWSGGSGRLSRDAPPSAVASVPDQAQCSIPSEWLEAAHQAVYVRAAELQQQDLYTALQSLSLLDCQGRLGRVEPWVVEMYKVKSLCLLAPRWLSRRWHRPRAAHQG